VRIFSPGPVNYAVNLAGAGPFAIRGNEQGPVGMYLKMIVRKDSPYQKLQDLKGKRQQPKVSAVRDGDKLVLRVENQRNRCRTTWFGLSPELDVNCFGFVRLHVSGPLSPSPAPQSSNA